MANARLLWVGYSGKSSYAHADVLKRLWQRHKIDFCAAVGVKPNEGDDVVLDKPLISHHDALFARYQGLEGNFEAEIDRRSYELFSPFEGETLRMMDRLHFRGPKYPFHDCFDTRRTMFLRHCLFWKYFLKESEITHVLFNGLPHEVYTFVLYKVAKILEIPTLILHPEKVGLSRKSDGIFYGLYPQKTMHQNLFYVSTSIEDIGIWDLSREIGRASQDLNTEILRGDPFSRIVKESEDAHTQSTRIIRHSSFLRFFSELKNKSKRPREIYLFFRRSTLSGLQKREHLKISKGSENLQNSVIYFLPYQPEESSSPRAGIFVEQFFTIKCVADSLPDGWTLRVREHPDQYGRRRPRPKGFLREISEISRVSIVPLDETVNQSFSNVQAAVAIAGTSCIEAWLRKIPLLLFGEMFLKKAPGVFFIETKDDIRKAFGTIQNGNQISQNEIDDFVSWTSENSFVGALNKVDSSVPDLHKNTVNNLDTVISTWFGLTL